MDLHITGLMESAAFVPEKPTYAIRIFSPNYPSLSRRYRLRESGLWTAVDAYSFSDIWPGSYASPNDIMFTDSIARELVENFAKHAVESESLLVHCSRGANRSPAVAIGLNDAFELGHDPDELRERYNESNWYVCRLVAEAGFRHIGKDPFQNEINTFEKLNDVLGSTGLTYLARASKLGAVNMLYSERDADAKLFRRITRRSKKHFAMRRITMFGPRAVRDLVEYGFDPAELTPEQLEKLSRGVEVVQFKEN